MRYMFVALLCVFGMTGCQRQDQERVYHEVVIKQPDAVPAMMQNPHGDMGTMPASTESSLKWDVPTGWEALAGGGMRVVSFRKAGDPDAVDVSIVSLSGAAGGLEANLVRWGNQIGIDLEADPNKFKEFVTHSESLKTRQGLQAQLFDFRKLQPGGESEAKSMVAAMLVWPDETVFVKMTGSPKTIGENLDAFESLVGSVGKK